MLLFTFNILFQSEVSELKLNLVFRFLLINLLEVSENNDWWSLFECIFLFNFDVTENLLLLLRPKGNTIMNE